MLYFLEKIKAGEAGFYAERKRGTVQVRDDATIYVYKKPWLGVKKFKRELYTAFGERRAIRIEGVYPFYTIIYL